MGVTPIVGANGFAATAADGESHILLPCLGDRIIKKCHQTLALKYTWGSQTGKFSERGIEINQFGNLLGLVPVGILHPWNRENERHTGRFFK